VRYVTHQFAHIETLERARRWLAQSGFDPARIEARTHGILSLSVAVEQGESAEVQRIIDAAESSDPDGNPGIWDVANQRHVHPQADNSIVAAGNASHSESFVVGWRPQDAEREVTQTDTELQKGYREGKG
jgi:hypothetical protein